MAQGALPGFRDFYPDQFAERAHVMGVWGDVARRFAFSEYDGPPLEPLDLYTKKSGDEIVGQLYNFTDKGGREVALRPEMTPTLARMAAAKANALRKPIRWFSMPQLFRYERQQRGRLREHFQLNVDIIGEADVTADAELLAVAIEIMRGCGLTSSDVRARVSDRRLLRAILTDLGVADSQTQDRVLGVMDKAERVDDGVTGRRLHDIFESVATDVDDRIHAFVRRAREYTLERLDDEFSSDAVRAATNDFRRYVAYLADLGVDEFVQLDLSVVRGLAYYTGIVFEIFDAQGELRAICGGGRYDSLLKSLGGVDLPALGFGMGDVVLSELLRDRGLMPKGNTTLDVWVAAHGADPLSGGAIRRAATSLRRDGFSVEYGLRAQSLNSQDDAAKKAGAEFLVVLAPAIPDSPVEWAKVLNYGTKQSEDVELARLGSWIRANSARTRSIPIVQTP